MEGVKEVPGFIELHFLNSPGPEIDSIVGVPGPHKESPGWVSLKI